jgi:hypothetical protein
VALYSLRNTLYGWVTLRIDSAAIIDATGRADVLAAGAAVAGARTEFLAPVAVMFTVSGARPETQLRAVAHILRRDGLGWNAQDPVVVPGSGQVELDISGVPAGDHDIDLIAWAPDATAKPVSINPAQADDLLAAGWRGTGQARRSGETAADRDDRPGITGPVDLGGAFSAHAFDRVIVLLWLIRA